MAYKNHAENGRPQPEQKNILETTDPYEILGVSRFATQEEIKKSYRKLSKEHHPDKHLDSSLEIQKLSEEMTKKINLAYEEVVGAAQAREELTSDESERDRQERLQEEGDYAFAKAAIQKAARTGDSEEIARVIERFNRQYEHTVYYKKGVTLDEEFFISLSRDGQTQAIHVWIYGHKIRQEPQKITVREAPFNASAAISGAKTFTELYGALYQVVKKEGAIPGSDGGFSKSDIVHLFRLIKSVYQQPEKINEIPVAFGIREKVQELIVAGIKDA